MSWTTETRTGYRTKTLRRGNAVVVIHRPIFETEEAAKREGQVMAALAQIKTKEKTA